MYSMFHLPVSPFSSLGQILSVLFFCSAATNWPSATRSFIGMRFLVMMIFPLNTSSGLAARRRTRESHHQESKQETQSLVHELLL